MHDANMFAKQGMGHGPRTLTDFTWCSIIFVELMKSVLIFPSHVLTGMCHNDDNPPHNNRQSTPHHTAHTNTTPTHTHTHQHTHQQTHTTHKTPPGTKHTHHNTHIAHTRMLGHVQSAQPTVILRRKSECLDMCSAVNRP